MLSTVDIHSTVYLSRQPLVWCTNVIVLVKSGRLRSSPDFLTSEGVVQFAVDIV